MGKTIELPCAVGDKIWHIVPNSYKTNFHLFGGNILGIEMYGQIVKFLIGKNVFAENKYVLYLRDYNRTWFSNKQEAEKRLKELKNDK